MKKERKKKGKTYRGTEKVRLFCFLLAIWKLKSVVKFQLFGKPRVVILPPSGNLV